MFQDMQKGAGGTQWYEKELNMNEDVNMDQYDENICWWGWLPNNWGGGNWHITCNKVLIWQLVPKGSKLWYIWYENEIVNSNYDMVDMKMFVGGVASQQLGGGGTINILHEMG